VENPILHDFPHPPAVLDYPDRYAKGAKKYTSNWYQGTVPGMVPTGNGITW